MRGTQSEEQKEKKREKQLVNCEGTLMKLTADFSANFPVQKRVSQYIQTKNRKQKNKNFPTTNTMLGKVTVK